MAYLPEERETVIHYDELENAWTFESNVRRHVTKILKMEHAFHSVEKEFENDFCIYVKATLKNLEDFSVSPFVKNKRKMTEEQRQEISERMKRVLCKIS
ncbi:hypothetical protein [Streptococcus suis]|uniref:hypothetical protein n=1 Tax=Streptococcus suis TaxID=1307 RepID=UPI000C1A7477|nr:hypothetical protein [Streptococcus suis]MDG3286328.1 hypothetical protein [Streptococcus suis]UCS84706.1 hypothetical protein JZ789_11060 [Streptococcus suis]UCS85007.1 hypothetical protein JZ789_01105 [Streptococcus suis]HEM2808328.1 hypothetical protein [Streptococcus suis]